VAPGRGWKTTDFTDIVDAAVDRVFLDALEHFAPRKWLCGA
jgi:hypothetical protein